MNIKDILEKAREISLQNNDGEFEIIIKRTSPSE